MTLPEWEVKPRCRLFVTSAAQAPRFCLGLSQVAAGLALISGANCHRCEEFCLELRKSNLSPAWAILPWLQKIPGESTEAAGLLPRLALAMLQRMKILPAYLPVEQEPGRIKPGSCFSPWKQAGQAASENRRIKGLSLKEASCCIGR